MKHIGTVELKTERLILRRLQISDATEMFKNWASDDEVTKFLTWKTHENVEVTKSYILFCLEKYKNDDYYDWVIQLKSTGEIIGTIGVTQIDESACSANIGYCMGKKWWGNNIMPEAGRAVLAFLFECVGFNRVAAFHDKNNPKSGRVMQKIGMTYEGILRSGGHNNQGIIDKVMYSILKSEWK